jgi:hypothetical protein
MSAIDAMPQTKNFLSPLNFTFVLKRSPNLNFFVQRVNIPRIRLDYLSVPSPLLQIPLPNGRTEFDDLSLTFKVDEDLQNYMEIYNWITDIGSTVDQSGYAKLRSNTQGGGENATSDISLIVSDGLKNPNYEVIYVNAFPIDLGDLVFETSDTDINYVSASVTFKYTYYTINKV